MQDLRDARDVLGEIEQTAKRLAELGDRERPKAEAFIKSARDAAREVRELRQPPPIVGPDGRAIPTGRGIVPPRPSGDDDRFAPPPITTGGGGGTGFVGPAQTVTAVQRGLSGERVVKPLDWVQEHCDPKVFRIPRPGNPAAVFEDDYVEISGWSCARELHMESDFYNPAEWAALTGAPALLGSSTSGGNRGGGGASRPRGPGTAGALPGATYRSTFVKSDDSSSVSAPTPTSPTPGDKLVAEALKTGFREVVQELRQTADIGLAIRRNGGL